MNKLGFKDGEKNEKVIRCLLKLPANRRCINCNSLGPQYVCTNFWIFICATCSGIHREFTHRVKSVSMATFTSEEVSCLQRGGNERAKEFYFKAWDPQRQSAPDSSNVEGLRKFIKHVYVDRRYTGEKSVDQPATPKKVDREDSYTGRSGLPYLDINPKRFVERCCSSGRSNEGVSSNSCGERNNHGHGKESVKYIERKRISAFFEEVDDSLRDHLSKITQSEVSLVPNRIHHLDRRPSNRHKALDSSKPREVRPLRDILDRIPSLRLSEALKKEDGGRPSNGSVRMEKTASAIKGREVDGNSAEPKGLNHRGHERKNSGSTVSIRSDPVPASQAQQSQKSTGQSMPKPTCSPNSSNSGSSSYPIKKNQSEAASNAKSLNSVVPAAKEMGSMTTKPSTGCVLNANTPNMPRIPSSCCVPSAAPLSNVLTSSPNPSSPNPKAAIVSAASPLPNSDATYSSAAIHVKQDQGVPQPQRSIFPETAIQSPSNVPSCSPSLQSSQSVSQQIPQTSSEVVLLPSVQTFSGEKKFTEGHGTGPAVASHSGPLEQKCSGRKELPQHLFSAPYSSAPVQSPGWQPVQAHCTGYSMPNSSAMQVPTMYQPGTLANPFDLYNGTNPLQSPMLSCMASPHGVQPNGLFPTSTLQSCSPCTQWMPLPAQSSPYGALPFQPLSISTSGMPSSSYIEQQGPNKLPPAGYQGVQVLGNNLAFLGTLDTQQPGGRFSTLQSSPSSVGGNPFA